MNEVKEYKHTNGYSAKLYGISSMSVFYEGKEVTHTGFRNVNSEEEVMDLLEEYPSFIESLKESLDNGLLDNDNSELL